MLYIHYGYTFKMYLFKLQVKLFTNTETLIRQTMYFIFVYILRYTYYYNSNFFTLLLF